MHSSSYFFPQHISSQFVSVFNIHTYYANKGHCKCLFMKYAVYKVTRDCFQAQISSLGPHAKDKMITVTIPGKVPLSPRSLWSMKRWFFLLFQNNILIENVVNIWGLFKCWKHVQVRANTSIHLQNTGEWKFDIR